MARKKKHEEHVNHERWLVSYADFITLLFAFFVVMFAVSQVDSNKVGRFTESVQAATQWGVFPQAGSRTPAVDNTGIATGVLDGPHMLQQQGSRAAADSSHRILQDKLRERLTHVLAGGKVALVETDEGLVLRLTEATFFDSGSAELRKEGMGALRDVGESIRDLPNAVRIEGHSDVVPIRTAVYRSNWDLSASRAGSVLAYLADELAVSEDRLSIAGYAARRPIATNDTPEGRQKNRRVDIVILEPRS